MRRKENSRNPYCTWSGRKDLNLRPLAPHASALPGCATPRMIEHINVYMSNSQDDFIFFMIFSEGKSSSKCV